MARVRLKNGVAIEIEPGETPEQAIDRYVAQVYKEKGVDQNYDLGTATKENQRMQMTKWAEDRPITGRAAAINSGVRNTWRNIGQILTPESLEDELGVTDADIKGRQATEQALKDTYPGAYLAGEIGATAPIGAGAGALTKAPMLAKLVAKAPKLAAFLSSAAQGGLLGAASAGPDNRVSGAVTGAIVAPGVSAVLNKVGQAATRGLAPMTAKYANYRNAVGGLDDGASKAFPLSATAAREGEGSMLQRAYESVIPAFPAARRAIENQAKKAEMSAYGALTRLGYGPKVGAQVMDDFAPKGVPSNLGGLADALRAQAGQKLNPAGSAVRDMLKEAADKGTRGTPTLTQIGNAGKGMTQKTAQRATDIAWGAADLLQGSVVKGMTVAQRDRLYKILGRAASISTGGVLGGVARVAATQFAQNVLRGNTVLQRKLLELAQRKGVDAAAKALSFAARSAAAANDPESTTSTAANAVSGFVDAAGTAFRATPIGIGVDAAVRGVDKTLPAELLRNLEETK